MAEACGLINENNTESRSWGSWFPFWEYKVNKQVAPCHVTVTFIQTWNSTSLFSSIQTSAQSCHGSRGPMYGLDTDLLWRRSRWSIPPRGSIIQGTLRTSWHSLDRMSVSVRTMRPCCDNHAHLWLHPYIPWTPDEKMSIWPIDQRKTKALHLLTTLQAASWNLVIPGTLWTESMITLPQHRNDIRVWYNAFDALAILVSNLRPVK